MRLWSTSFSSRAYFHCRLCYYICLFPLSIYTEKVFNSHKAKGIYGAKMYWGLTIQALSLHNHLEITFLGNRIPQRYFFISPLDMMYHFLLSTNRILGHQNELAKFGCANLSKEEYDYENLTLITCNPFLRQIAVMTTAEKPSLPLTMKRVQLHVCTFDRHKL